MLAPARRQLVERPRIEDRTAEVVVAWLGGLVDDGHRQLLPSLVGESLEPDGRGQTSGPGADHEDIE